MRLHNKITEHIMNTVRKLNTAIQHGYTFSERALNIILEVYQIVCCVAPLKSFAAIHLMLLGYCVYTLPFLYLDLHVLRDDTSIC